MYLLINNYKNTLKTLVILNQRVDETKKKEIKVVIIKGTEEIPETGELQNIIILGREVKGILIAVIQNRGM